jgi:hypothetical protein
MSDFARWQLGMPPRFTEACESESGLSIKISKNRIYPLELALNVTRSFL